MNKIKNLTCNIYKYTCSYCHKSYESPVYIGGYGQFLLRNYGSKHLAWLDAVDDSTFKEVGTLIRMNSEVAKLGRNKQSDIFQKIVGYAYDTDNNGNYFGIDAEPECPYCKKHSALSYQEAEPPVYKTFNVPMVTSIVWDSLTTEKKRQLLVSKLVEKKLI
jgi:hypothetical protein